MLAVGRSCEDKRHVLSVCTLENRAHDDALGLLRRHALAYALRLALEQHRRVRCTASSAQRSNHTAFWSKQSKETTHFLSKIGCPRPAQTRPRSSSRRTTDQSQQQSSPSLRQGERKGNSPPTATGSSPRSTRPRRGRRRGRGGARASTARRPCRALRGASSRRGRRRRSGRGVSI